MTSYYIIANKFNEELKFDTWKEAQQYWFNDRKCAILYIVTNQQKRKIYER